MWNTRNSVKRETYVKDILKETRQSDDVNEQMDSLAKYLVLKTEEISQRHEVAHLIETSLKEYFPECVSHLFGSSVNGVGFKESDVDIYLDLQKEPSLFKKSGREIGEKIVSILKKIPEITNVEGILGARIPIVRFVHEESNLKCDLSFHNMMSVMNSKFLKMCQQADPRINTLMVVIKFWAEFQELSGSADGTNRNRKMSNYALNLLVIFFLQNEKFLPSVKELHYNTVGEDSCIINGFECGFPRDLSLWKIPLDGFPNEKSVSELLHNFFEFYADFDYEGCIISPYAGVALVKDPGGGIKIPIKEGKDRIFWNDYQGRVLAQDPFDHSYNVTHSFLNKEWRFLCNTTSKIIKKWIEGNAEKSNLQDIFEKSQFEWPSQTDYEAGKKIKFDNTVYLKGFDKRTALDEVLSFFSKYDNVLYVKHKKWLDTKIDLYKSTGVVYVTFTDRTSAENFLALESVQNSQGKELIRKWKPDNENCPQNAPLSKGTILFMEGIKDDTTKDDIKEALMDQFSVEADDFAFMEFKKGQNSCENGQNRSKIIRLLCTLCCFCRHFPTESMSKNIVIIRFAEENAAINLAAEITDKLGKEPGSKLKIKEDEIDFRVLEEQEETIYLRKEHKRLKSKRNREHAKARKRKEKNSRDSQTFIEVVGKRRFHPCFNF